MKRQDTSILWTAIRGSWGGPYQAKSCITPTTTKVGKDGGSYSKLTMEDKIKLQASFEVAKKFNPSTEGVTLSETPCDYT